MAAAADSKTINGNSEAAEGINPEDNPWDDSLLIRAYDRAVNLAKKNMEKIMPDTPNPKIVLFQAKDNYSDKNENSPGSPENTQPSHETPMKWKRGMYCRCVYSADGVEYEAEVVNIKRNKATIRYLGYNNEETVPLHMLTLSHGPAVRQLQIDQYMNEQSGATDETEDMNLYHTAGSPQIVTNGIVPPPPPPALLGHLSQTEEEALSAMLMSWYMSGYHTGYYQGLKNSSNSYHQKSKK